MRSCGWGRGRFNHKEQPFFTTRTQVAQETTKILENHATTNRQGKLSDISFGIAPAKIWDENTHQYSEKANRNSDLYVFCVYKERISKEISNLLDMNNWQFWLLKTQKLDEKMPEQKKISLNVLEKMATKCGILDLKEKIEQIIGKNNI